MLQFAAAIGANNALNTCIFDSTDSRSCVGHDLHYTIVHVWLCVRTHLYTSHLCRLDVTVHLVVQLAHLELQQRERGDMSFRTQHALKQQLRCLIDVDWSNHNILSVRVTVTLLQLAQILR